MLPSRLRVAPVWLDGRPVRAELFSTERLEDHGHSLARAQRIEPGTLRSRQLLVRLDDNADALRRTYRETAHALEAGRPIAPAAEWLIDNYHIVEKQIRKIRDDLPADFYRQLPKLADGPLATLPRVFSIAWAYASHSDSLFDEDRFRRFLLAYQQVNALTIGELWATAISMQLVLVENLRRLADIAIADEQDRARAEAFADALFAAPSDAIALASLATIDGDQPVAFVSQLALRLRDTDTRSEIARRWLEAQAAGAGTSIAAIDTVAQAALIASTGSIRNVITSMRTIAELDWGEMVESLSLADRVLRTNSDFASMDFPSRNLYRNALEELSRGSAYAEDAVAARAIALTEARIRDNAVDKDPGYFLIGTGRPQLEMDIGFVPPVGTRLARRVREGGILFYIAVIMLVALVLLSAPVSGLGSVRLPPWFAIPMLAAAMVMAIETATAIVNRAMASLLPPRVIPALELKDGVGPHLQTLVVVPILLGSDSRVHEEIGDLEIHHLTVREDAVRYALLSDFADASAETLPGEAERLASAHAEVDALNARYPVADGSPRFLFLHRRRQFNPAEGCWMGWERKRGKLHELNRLLRGATDTSYYGPDGSSPAVPGGIRYVITLDADTRLPLGAAQRMIGKMAHPLNRPRFDTALRRVVAGYGIMQPRVTVALPVGRGQSPFEALAGGPAGIDPYAAAASDLYQDLLGEGSFTGKGIYEIDTFMASMTGRVPPNTMLSHDLFEGVYARAGLISDVEVVEDFPVRYDAAARRQHRWVRGDWQLLPWILSLRRSPSDTVPGNGRAKMLDNLRRSLVAPSILATLIGAWFMPSPAGLRWTLGLLLLIVIPPLLPLPSLLLSARRRDVPLRAHIGAIATDVRASFGHVALQLATVADQAIRMVDAIVRTLIRLFITRRHLLEWTTAASASAAPNLGLVRTYGFMARSVALAIAAAAAAVWFRPEVWPLLMPLTLLWLAAPAIAWAISQPRPIATAPHLDSAQRQALEAIALQTWRFFTTHVTAEHHHLPPDNFQETPEPVVAGRTSPTNIGLYLLVVATAQGRGWCTRGEALDRLEATFTTLRTLPRFRGHLFNWYDTRDLRVLEPAYVSAVDSGNLAGHLIALANLLDGWSDPDRAARLAAEARAMAIAMDFAFLIDPDRLLLSIGWSVADNRRDESCYDLLASEARLASLFAIAKGDVPARHWFRLGRSATPAGGASILISWSGSMFEYLMPSLLMRAPDGSLLETSNRLVVQRQRDYAGEAGVPWGISESAYNARDREMTYQYSNFGVPGLGLKRGLSENLVIAPYATGLATMVDADAALANLSALEAIGGRGEYGFYEAIDFTPARVPEGQRCAVVRTYMAHHQGMALLAIVNILDGGRLRDAFHAEPMIRATELLLHERPPRGVGTFSPRAEEAAVSAVDRPAEAAATRIYGDRPETAQPVHLLSNGRYAVLLTSAGAGYSRWKGLSINRWREDPVIAGHGSWLYVNDRQTGEAWSATLAPLATQPTQYNAIFTEGRAEFRRRDGVLATTTEILIAPEDDAEVRRVSVANRGNLPRRIEVTSLIELTLGAQATDLAHPAFARMFIETEWLDGGILVAHRRPRGSDDPAIWIAHLAIVEGEATGPIGWETDRGAFLGRGRTAGNPLALGGALVGHVGTVLDPVLALSCPVVVPPGQTVRVAFWTIAADSREALLEAVDRHRDASAFDRAEIGAWTQAQIERRFLRLDPGDAADFQRLAGHIVFAGTAHAPPPALVAAAAAPQSALWVHGISGDLPIVAVRIDDPRDMGVVTDLLRAFEFLQARYLAFDLVILNERKASYIQDLQNGLDDAVRAVRARPAPPGVRGEVYTLRSDLMLESQVATLRALSRVEILAQRGSLRRQLQRPETAVPAGPPQVLPAARDVRPGRPRDAALPTPQTLEFWNGFGGFHADGREYAMILNGTKTTPAPWINVLANPEFGCQVSADGLGAVWSGNARENLLTPWSNDTVSDPPGDVLYLRDLDTGQLWSPTHAPAGGGGARITRHGYGYSRFHAACHGIESDLLVHVPLDAPVRLARLTLRNLSDEPRGLSVTGYAEWVLGAARSKTASHIVTEHDADTGALFARNPFEPETGTRIAFADLDGCQTGWTCDRAAFIGRDGSLVRPSALARDVPLKPASGAGLDPCAVLTTDVTLAPGESREIVWTIGQAADRETARALIHRWRAADLDAELARTTEMWRATLGTVQLRSPDRAMDIMLNGWLLYQVLGCRVWGRAGFYQASGAYGFRDQLQDGGALLLARPDLVRPHLLRAAGRQFREGDVQHWWLPESGRGVRTRISDDRGWLAMSVADYVESTGDEAILDTRLPFLLGRALEPGEHDAFYLPETSLDVASLYTHCALALDQSVAMTGALGLPLIGGGDWNDGMNRVGEGGQGMSVWLGWHLIHAINRFAPFADAREPERAARWRAHAASVAAAIEASAWDGEWYRRATYDDGTWLGSTTSDECKIDSIAQTWAVISRAGDPARAAQAMASVRHHLVDREERLVKLFTPPFEHTAHDPGYIRSYPPGLRENGGQYSHAAMWTIVASAMMGDGRGAVDMFDLLNPINHALTADDALHYRVEPYVVAADIYSVAPNDGRGGWTWYTGAAGWMYRAGVEHILGLRRAGTVMHMKPCFPGDWPGATVTLNLGDAHYLIEISRTTDGAKPHCTLDGEPMVHSAGATFWTITAGTHEVRLSL